jgi:hypothetical protein
MINVRVMRKSMPCESSIIRMFNRRSIHTVHGIVFYNSKKMKSFYSKITLYVVRVGRNHELYDSSPCEQCAKTIKMLNVKRIVFTNKYGLLEKHNPQTYNTNFITTGNRRIQEKMLFTQHNSRARHRRLELLAKYHN